MPGNTYSYINARVLKVNGEDVATIRFVEELIAANGPYDGNDMTGRPPHKHINRPSNPYGNVHGHEYGPNRVPSHGPYPISPQDGPYRLGYGPSFGFDEPPRVLDYEPNMHEHDSCHKCKGVDDFNLLKNRPKYMGKRMTGFTDISEGSSKSCINYIISLTEPNPDKHPIWFQPIQSK